MADLIAKLKETAKYVDRDIKRLESWGYVVLKWDYPTDVIFPEEIRRKLATTKNLRIDLIFFKPGHPLAFWEVQTRDVEIDGFFLLPVVKWKRYWRIFSETGAPVFISLYAGAKEKKWLGYFNLRDQYHFEFFRDFKGREWVKIFPQFRKEVLKE